MIIRLRYSILASVILLWSIVGFQLLAGLLNAVGLPSTAASIVFRAGVAGLALLLVGSVLARQRFPRNLGFGLIVVFWSVYLVRLVHDSVFAPGNMAQPVFIYWSFAVGACLVPALALAFHAHRIDARAISGWIIALALVFLIVTFFIGHTDVQARSGGAYDTGRIMTDSINPIKVGHTAVTAMLCIYWRLRFGWRASILAQLALLPVALFCAYMMFASGSRGPIVALILGVIFLEAAKGGWVLALVATLGAPLAALLAFDLSVIDETLGVNLVSRLESGFDASDQSSSMRIAFLSGAWRIFLDHPLAGGALEDPDFGIYPHNIIVEAFMATGIFGGTALVIACIWALLRAFYSAVASPSTALFAVLFVQYLAAVQFSGSIWGAMPFWTMFGCIVALDMQRAGRRREPADGHAERPTRHLKPWQQPTRQSG